MSPSRLASSAEDLIYIFRRPAVARVDLQELGKAEDGIERRAQIMAHAREEIAFCEIRPLRIFRRRLERSLGLAPLADLGQEF